MYVLDDTQGALIKSSVKIIFTATYQADHTDSENKSKLYIYEPSWDKPKYSKTLGVTVVARNSILYGFAKAVGFT